MTAALIVITLMFLASFALILMFGMYRTLEWELMPMERYKVQNYYFMCILVTLFPDPLFLLSDTFYIQVNYCIKILEGPDLASCSEFSVPIVFPAGANLRKECARGLDCPQASGCLNLLARWVLHVLRVTMSCLELMSWTWKHSKPSL